jgi:hypothetical protein
VPDRAWPGPRPAPPGGMVRPMGRTDHHAGQAPADHPPAVLAAEPTPVPGRHPPAAHLPAAPAAEPTPTASPHPPGAHLPAAPAAEPPPAEGPDGAGPVATRVADRCLESPGRADRPAEAGQHRDRPPGASLVSTSWQAARPAAVTRAA